MTQTAADGLTPSLLARLELIAPVVAVRPLVGGRGGRTFAVRHRGLVTVVHLRPAGPAALARESRAAGRAHAAGVGPEVLAVLPEHDALVTRWVTGAVLATGDLRDAAVVREVARSVRRLHDAPVGDVTDPYDALGFRAAYLEAARSRGLDADPLLAAGTARTTRIVDELVATARAHPATVVHADLVPSNLVLAPGGVVLLDHEYAGLADPSLDLGSLAATAELDDRGLAALVDAYRVAGTDGSGPGAAVTFERVRAWREVTAHAWCVWVALGDELGPERARWQAWAARTRARL